MNATIKNSTNQTQKRKDYEYEDGEIDEVDYDELSDEEEEDDDEVDVETNNIVDDDDENDDENDDDDDENDDENDDNDNNIQPKVDIEPRMSYNDDYNEDDDDDEDDDYLQKFDKNISEKVIAEYHPELQSHNYDEVNKLAIVVRDVDGIIIDPLHRSLPFITRYEKTKILGERAKQLNSGAVPLVEIDQSLIDGYLIALKEYAAKKIPYIIKRPMPNGGCEYWKFEDLEELL